MFLIAGFVASLLVIFLFWAELTAPAFHRLPVPSPDGRYFVYFDRTGRASSAEEGPFDLIISTATGALKARFRSAFGPIFWSNVGHLAVLDRKENKATLIANAEGRFLALPPLVVSPGTEPRWSPDGTKLAFIQPASTGPAIAVYDVPQTQAFPIPQPQGIRLKEPTLLFWSAGGERLYFLDQAGPDVSLWRLDILSSAGEVLARGNSHWKNPAAGSPRLSPDGVKIYLPSPVHAVIDAFAGQAIWNLPSEAKPLWSLWSADGRQLFYARSDLPGQILAHDFLEMTDKVILSNARPDGFLAADNRTYFYRLLQRPGPGVREWLKDRWGWYSVDVQSQSAQPLGRIELYPWEQTQRGWILAQRDEYRQVKFGLYDPNGRIFSEYVFPTFRDVIWREVRSSSPVLIAVALYALIGFVAYWRGATGAAARALYFFSLLLMLVFTCSRVIEATAPFPQRTPFPVSWAEIVRLGWDPRDPLLWLLWPGVLFLLISCLALLPSALLNLSFVFPEGNRFLADRKIFRALLYTVSFVPIAGVVALKGGELVPQALADFLPDASLAAGSVSVITAFLAFLHSYRHPPDQRARDQARWAAMALGFPLAGLAILWLVNFLVSFSGRLFQKAPQPVLNIFSTNSLSVLCLFTPMAIGYAVTAHKLFDIRLLVRRTLRYSLTIFVLTSFFLLLLGGLSWAIVGSFGNPSRFTVTLSLLLTGLVLVPTLAPLQRLIDRTLGRTTYDLREALENFADSLPDIFDRQTLATRMSEILVNMMKCRSFHLFALDRKTGKLRPQRGKAALRQDTAEVEFDPSEPLCRYILEDRRPFEVDVSPYSPKLTPVFRSVADRLGRLHAAVVVGIERKGTLLGLMVLGPKTSEEFYNAEELGLLRLVATQAAVTMENTEVLEEVARDRESEQERDAASRVQAHLFPATVPSLPGCQLAGRCLPARSVSGDYYDFLEIPGHKIGLAIGDVSGRGMSASLLMASLQNLLREQAPAADNLGDLVRRINRQLYIASRGAKYCTFFYGMYDHAARRLYYVNAGYNPPLLVNATGVRFLESTGIPLGLFQEASHETQCEALEPGNLLVLCSDGISEARNARGELYGVERLIKVVSSARELDAGAILEKIFNDLHAFCGKATVEDDQTLALLKVSST